ncbi:MAG TPA: heavy-metal-associated domain-containing protein [Longimicrobiales bacterium]
MKTSNLKIRALTCPHCAREVEKMLVAERGVRTAAVRPGAVAGAEVEYDETTVTPEQLVAVLRRKGYDAEIGGYSAGGAP